MNDLRPVALTSVPMKVAERLFKNHLSSTVKQMADPLQFAYQEKRNCSDAIVVMLAKIYSHLENSRHGNSVRIMFFDFSSAFNTIQPHILINKLMGSVPCSLLQWILNYLTNRTQCMKLPSGTTSATIISNTGAPQGTVLAPFLFTLYTADCRSTIETCLLIKFADGTAMIGLITKDNDSVYIDQVNSFVKYCDTNYLELNVVKTKEMIIDYRKKQQLVTAIIIKGVEVENIETYKYLGLTLDNKLNWHSNADILIKKLNIRMYSLRKLYTFGVNCKVLLMFYNTIIASVWRYCLVVWGGNMTRGDRDRLDKLIKEAGRVIGEALPNIQSVYEQELGMSLSKIIKDVNHPLCAVLNAQIIPRSGRMRLPLAVTNRHSSSFIPQVIRLHNLSVGRTKV